MSNDKDVSRTEIFTFFLMDLMNREMEAQRGTVLTASDCLVDQGKSPCSSVEYGLIINISANVSVRNTSYTDWLHDWDPAFQTGIAFGAAPAFDSTEPNMSGVTHWIVAVWPHAHFPEISTSRIYVLNSQELPWVSVMIYYWMVNCRIAGLWIDSVRALREWTLLWAFSASSQRNSKRAKVTACGLQWSHLSCCSIPVWAPGDHSHPDQWSRSPRSCQSACRPRKMTRRWLEKKQSGDRNQLFLRESAHAQAVCCCLTHLTAQHLYLWTISYCFPDEICFLYTVFALMHLMVQTMQCWEDVHL